MYMNFKLLFQGQTYFYVGFPLMTKYNDKFKKNTSVANLVHIPV